MINRQENEQEGLNNLKENNKKISKNKKSISEETELEIKSENNPLFYQINSVFSNSRTIRSISRDTYNTSEISIKNKKIGNFTSLANSKVFHPKEKKSKILFTFKEGDTLECDDTFNTTMEDNELLKTLNLQSCLLYTSPSPRD